MIPRNPHLKHFENISVRMERHQYWSIGRDLIVTMFIVSISCQRRKLKCITTRQVNRSTEQAS
jgi:hypothetical protein